MLSSATELIVAPRSRHPPRPDIPVIPDLSATPSARGVTSAAAAEWEQIWKHLLRLLPASKPPARVADAAVARHNAIYVSPGVHDIVRRAFPGDTKITLSHYPRPVSRHSASASQAPPPDSASHGKTADDEQAGASGEQAPPAQQQRSSVEVHIEASSDVPPAHVWVPAELRRELGIKDGKEFELVK